MNVLRVYDNGGETFDRFTVYYSTDFGNGHFECRTMSENPFHPQGFGQMCSGQLGLHNGKEIEFDDLPAPCRKLVLMDQDSWQDF